MKISPIQNILLDKYSQYLNKLRIFEDDKHIELSIIRLNSNSKNKGIGSTILDEIINYSEQINKPITLTPTEDYGSDIKRLVQFYTKKGFIKNNNKDFDDKLIRPMIKEEKKECGCGCNTCDTKIYTINESKIKNITLSEGLNYIVNNNINLIENIYRYSSKLYLDVIKEARELHSKGIMTISKDDEWILTESNIGEYGIYNNKKVLLDIIFEDKIPGGLADKLTLKDIAKKHNISFENLRKELKKGLKVELEHTSDSSIAFEIAKDHLFEDPYYYDKLQTIEEVKTPILNKPKRSTGPKKYYVYTKNPKTGNVIKVNFGDSGNLSAKINNPKARKSFAARHDCKNKKDKTKPGYWSCRLPYYTKSLGLKGGGNFFW